MAIILLDTMEFLTKEIKDGPNYALGGAVANDYLGGLQGALS